jgi:eukaryotic-like serine/threonine-protein kinase
MTPTALGLDHDPDVIVEQRPTTRKQFELKIGTLAGRYRVLQEIGRGGHGVVYRAIDAGLGREVALKTLGVANGEPQPVCPREAQLLSLIDNQHVVGIFDVFNFYETTILVMELADGLPLDMLVRKERLSAKEVSALGLQLAEGLDALHATGIVHGDIKPANLRLSRSGVLKILDLGVARRVPDVSSDQRRSTETQMIVGTVPYMSPEQLRGAPADIRSDIWSAGTVLFELATGRRAFGKLTTSTRLTRILNGIVPRPHEIRSDVPLALERVILKALNPDPRRRFQTAGALMQALYHVILEISSGSSRRRRNSPALSADTDSTDRRLEWNHPTDAHCANLR